jgi:hypothetical protein
MKPDPQDLEKIARLTLEHYNQRAEEFWEGTRDHDVGQNIAALLQYIDSKPPFTILNFGCGPGRDLEVSTELGHIVVGLEGAAHFAVMARAHSGCEVWQQDFLKLDLPDLPDVRSQNPHRTPHGPCAPFASNSLSTLVIAWSLSPTLARGTPGNVKLLLPPRQSRGNSHYIRRQLDRRT